MCSTDIFLGLLAVLFPPLPVWVKRGICSADSIINILLCILGYIPGLLHAWYIIAKHPEPAFECGYQHLPQDAEHGRIYVIVQDGGHGQQAPPQGGYQAQHQAPNPHQGNSMNYGTNNPAVSSAAAAAPHAPHHQHHQHQPQEQGTTAAAGPSDAGENSAPPPSYAQVVAGDHKVQTQD